MGRSWRQKPHARLRAASTPTRCQACSAVAKDRKSTRLNSSHLGISYAVFCLKKKIRTLEPPLKRMILRTLAHVVLQPIELFVLLLELLLALALLLIRGLLLILLELMPCFRTS